MEMLYLWPDNPPASLGLLWLMTVVLLWAAREPTLKLLSGIGGGLADGLQSLASRAQAAAGELAERNREILLAAGTRDAQGRLDRELERIDVGFSDKLGQYSALQRRLDEQLLTLDRDYRQCGIAPPEVPGWSAAMEAIAHLPMAGDPVIQKVLDGIKRSAADAEQKALSAYRDDSARRHELLGRMLPCWKDIRTLLGRMSDAVGQALESSARINTFIEDYAKIREDREEAARALTFSAWKYFFVSTLVLAIALGGAFINFQLIALPMSELVPQGARVGSIPVSTVSALVLVLMEAALGIFLMDILGITELFPKLATIPRSRRRLILSLALAGLFFLSGVESSLAILREQIVAADSALKLSLAGDQVRIVQTASESMIPVVGQAVLGFVLPWVLALVAIPVDMLLDSGRHVVGTLTVATLRTASALAGALAHATRHLTSVVAMLYDVYVSIPLKIERGILGLQGSREDGESFGDKRRGRRKGVA